MKTNYPRLQEGHGQRAIECIETVDQRLREIDTDNLFLEAAVSELANAVSPREAYAARNAMLLIRSVPVDTQRDLGKKRDAMQLLISIPGVEHFNSGQVLSESMDIELSRRGVKE